MIFCPTPAPHAIVYGAVPPEIAIFAFPVASPLHNTPSVEAKVTFKLAGSLITTVYVFSQLLLSLTTTLYDPATKPVFGKTFPTIETSASETHFTL